ncbi:hypothetical protein CHLRE_10g453800v5 [Chlamydomonas reinhardtii]|uniref:Uncharacterized protein n=1 Tax=Chlamydomonas reinhardtii TaxID=3055 RepID=A0A2K3DBD0_CHLRE|nr:uncharacterized protein CHLRE_10g453800v5 [Chlamydomonas reinhardtii]PNW77837.1 hypothetical protein CHLRE_10g453800v5 [Chlamydomonas reinhardtii]
MAQVDGHALEVLGEDLWARLTPELIQEITRYLHPNEVISSVKLLNRETTECLRDSTRTFVLGCKQGDRVWNPEKPHYAEQPWPGRDFVAHWGGPGPWRSLSLAQRHRLLCLAASSGHLPSLDAALAQCGCTLTSGALASAAAGGSVAACERLLGAGAPASCEAYGQACVAAAAGGHVPVLRLLLDRTRLSKAESSYTTSCTAAARAGQLPALQLLLDSPASGAVRARVLREVAAGAFAGGQLGVVVWLLKARGYIPSLRDAVAAARGGQVALLEQLLSPLVLQPDRLESELASGGNAAKQPLYRRWIVLEAITAGCPVEVLQRHYDRLWSLQASEDADEDPNFHIRRGLLGAVAYSDTACWGRKLDFFMSAWGPDVVARELQHRFSLGAFYGAAALRPDYAQRLRRLHAAGMPMAVHALRHAVTLGHVDALTYLLDEASAPAAAMETAFGKHSVCSQHRANLQLLRLLKERGYTFTATDVKAAASHSWPDEPLIALIQMAVDGGSEDANGSDWSAAFNYAAIGGASTCVLQALRARGAAVDLAAVAKGGSEEALDWAAAELEAQGQGGGSDGGALLISLGKADAKYIYARGNLAALRWLHRRGLLDCCSVSWLAGRVELGVAPAAAGGVEHGAGVLVGANASRDGVGPVEVVAGTGGALGRIAKWVHWVWRVGGAADRWTPAAGSGWCHWWPRVAYG